MKQLFIFLALLGASPAVADPLSDAQIHAACGNKARVRGADSIADFQAIDAEAQQHNLQVERCRQRYLSARRNQQETQRIQQQLEASGLQDRSCTSWVEYADGRRRCL